MSLSLPPLTLNPHAIIALAACFLRADLHSAVMLPPSRCTDFARVMVSGTLLATRIRCEFYCGSDGELPSNLYVAE